MPQPSVSWRELCGFPKAAICTSQGLLRAAVLVRRQAVYAGGVNLLGTARAEVPQVYMWQ